ncbi:hypothetical protein FACS1894170_02100 [Planctomycetales bacterium]|nr:hypothetical protein FACS1894170_02100 [Planctomycetales bacterium]
MRFHAILLFSILATPLFAQQTFLERLHNDWQRQDGGNNVQKVLTELGDNAAALQERLQTLQRNNVPQDDVHWQQLYFDACQERRKQRLEIVRQKYPVIVYAKHQVLGGSHYSYTEAPSDAQQPEQRDMLGGQLRQLTIKDDGTVDDTLLYQAPEGGTLRDPDVSFDGKKIVFSMRTSYDKDDYHLYDYDVATGKVRQLTFGLGFADVEPCYLPDGNIVFGSTRCMQIVDCWWTDVSNLYCIDGDGRFLRRFGFDQVHTNYPQVLNDGRVLYTRWDYNDRSQMFPHGLFVMNHDGTGQTEYYGNNSWFPTSILHARGIPNSNKVIAIASGHHTHQRGKLIVIDRGKGTQENQGAQLIAPVRETEAVKVDRYGQDGDQFQYPFAIDEENFIVAYTPDGFIGENYAIPFGLYYMDINNSKRELLAFDPKVSCGQPVALKEREVPMLRASSVDYTQKTGLYYVQDVYFGPGLQGIERGSVKQLRIVALEYRPAGLGYNVNRTVKRYEKIDSAMGAMSSTPISGDNGSWDVKRVLGTVPVEADGSVYFQVPVRTPVYFQLLDAQGFVVQTMRSWSTLQPGERQNCLGCHEDKNETKNNPLSRGGAMRTQALRKAPKIPKPEFGVDPNTGFSFAKYIQPILDRRCVSCHKDKRDGEDSPPFSLTGEISADKTVPKSLRYFSESYNNLTRQGRVNEWVDWLSPQSEPSMLPPYFAGSSKSKITSAEEFPTLMLRKRPRMRDALLGAKNQPQAQGVFTDAERRLMAMWIDLLVPFCGDYTEANAWSPEQKAEFAYYQMKRDKMAAIEKDNIEKFLQFNGGVEAPPLSAFQQFQDGGREAKRMFIEKYLTNMSGE